MTNLFNLHGLLFCFFLPAQKVPSVFTIASDILKKQGTEGLDLKKRNQTFEEGQKDKPFSALLLKLLI